MREEGGRTPARLSSRTVLQIVGTPTKVSAKDSSSPDGGLKEVSVKQ